MLQPEDWRPDLEDAPALEADGPGSSHHGVEGTGSSHHGVDGTGSSLPAQGHPKAGSLLLKPKKVQMEPFKESPNYCCWWIKGMFTRN